MREQTRLSQRLRRTPEPHPHPHRHTHRIEVETGDEPVHVTVGNAREEADGDGGGGKSGYVPGGFAKFFNRVIDCGLWATLPDAARAVYLPLVRLADGRGPFRARAGVASLMKHSGLSRSSVKRGLKALQDARLIVVVSAGGVGRDNVNRANLYELLIPEPADDGAPHHPGPAKSSKSSAKAKGRKASASVPEGVQSRTPSRPSDEPAGEPAADRGGVSTTNPRSGRTGARTGAGDGPHLRSSSQTPAPEQTGAGVELAEAEGMAVAVDGLRRWGFDAEEAKRLAGTFGPARVSRVLAEARQLRSAGRLRSASGFIRWSLDESDAAEAKSGESVSPAWDLVEARRRREEAAVAERDRQAEDAEVDSLPAEAIETLAAEVCERYADHPAMLRLLTSKPPTQSRLMRAEIAKLLREA